MDNLRDYIFFKKKAELHCHLDGSVKPEILYKYHQPNMPFDEFKSKMLVSEDCKDLLEYFNTFTFVLPMLQEEEILSLVAGDIVEQASFENVELLEIRFAPLLHREKGLSLKDIMEAVIHGINTGIKKTGIKAGIIICGLREKEPSTTIEMMKLAIDYLGKGVIGVDLAGDEEHYPPHIHSEGLHIAKEAGIPITIHAGEVAGPENMEYSIKTLGARRIGHGINLYKDSALEKYFIDNHIPLEICPRSNLQTKAAESIETHPVGEYLKKGVEITLNTDNRTASNTTLTDEILLVAETFRLSKEKIDKIIENGFKFSFIKD